MSLPGKATEAKAIPGLKWSRHEKQSKIVPTNQVKGNEVKCPAFGEERNPNPRYNYFSL